SRGRHTRFSRDWSSDVCSSDLGRDGDIVGRRAAELGIALMMHDVRDKAAAVQSLAQEHGLDLSEIGYMGDDIIDVPAMQRTGFRSEERRVGKQGWSSRQRVQ